VTVRSQPCTDAAATPPALFGERVGDGAPLPEPELDREPELGAAALPLAPEVPLPEPELDREPELGAVALPLAPEAPLPEPELDREPELGAVALPLAPEAPLPVVIGCALEVIIFVP